MKQTYEIDTANLTEEDKKILEILVEKAKIKKFEPIYPAKGSDVYYLYGDGQIMQHTFPSITANESSYRSKTLFKTLAEAEFERERRKVIFDLEEYKRQYDKIELDWEDDNQAKWCIRYDLFEEKFYMMDFSRLKGSEVYFSSREIAENAITIIGEDRIKKYYLGITD